MDERPSRQLAVSWAGRPVLAVSGQPAKKPAARFEANFQNNFEVKL